MAQFKVKGILSFPHLFNARAIEDGGEKKFSVAVLLRNDDPQLATVLQIQEQEKLNTFPSGFPANGKIFCKPSEDVQGYHVINGSAKEEHAPHIVDATGAPIMDRAQVYAGAEAWVQFNTYGYNKAVNKGVSAGLNGVLVTGVEGELGRIDGRPTAESMFGDILGGGAPAAAAAAAPAAAPAAAAPAPAPAAPSIVMTALANGVTLEQYLATPGWTEELLIEQGLAIRTSF